MATAPMFSDVVLSDPDEMMKVTNVGSVPLEWAGVRRVYVLEPKKTVFIPFHVCCKYLGDPRAEFKKQTVFQTPNGERGVVPERKGELIRLSVFYGLYHDKLNMLPKVAPKVSVYTLTDRELTFPISNPDSINYGYQTIETQNIDIRTELERVKQQMAELENRQHALTSNMMADDPEAGEATADTPPGM